MFGKLLSLPFRIVETSVEAVADIAEEVADAVENTLDE